MENYPTWLPVVAAALQSQDGRMLMQKRAAGTDYEGLWEFPGGKVEHGETPAQALIRELHEELSVMIPQASITPICFAQGNSENGRIPIVILLYTATISNATCHAIPTYGAGGESRWFDPMEMEKLEKPPLDHQLTSRLSALWHAKGLPSP